MGSMHEDGVKVDQINSAVMEGLEIVEENTVIMGGSLHESSIIIEWDQEGRGSQCI